MKEQTIIHTAVDLVSPDGDHNCETEVRFLPDGIEVISVRIWKFELELQANRPQITNGERQ